MVNENVPEGRKYEPTPAKVEEPMPPTPILTNDVGGEKYCKYSKVAIPIVMYRVYLLRVKTLFTVKYMGTAKMNGI